MSALQILDWIALVPALPLLGAAITLLAGRRLGNARSARLATTLMFLAFGVSLVMFFAMLSLPANDRSQVSTLFTWMRVDQLSVDIGFLVDPLSITWALLVTGVGSLIHLYAIGYMRNDPLASRFFGFFNLFAASMLILVLANNFLFTFLGWEGVGLCSYLLIAFWHQRPGAAKAGKKAFIYNRVGDVGFLIAMFLMINEYGSVDYGIVNNSVVDGSGVATAIALLLFLGAIGKSAQMPLFPWLADAMEGPTPVSALMHAATMVTAGVFLIARAHPIFEASSSAMTVVMWVGAATALIAGTIAVFQPDLKRVLAYSTISQLGYMFLALGVGAYVAAIFMMLMHAFFKGCLFLGAGSVIHGDAENQDLRIMGGFRKFLPVTAIAMMIGWLSIAGIPPFSGFWAKDGLLEAVFETHNYAPWIIGLLAAIITGIYMTRLIYLTFFGNERFRETPLPVVAGASDDAATDTHAVEAELGYDPDFEPTVAFGELPRATRLDGHDPHESPKIMLVPILVLAVLAAVAGFINLPISGWEFLSEWLAPVFKDVAEPAASSTSETLTLITISVIMAVTGITISYFIYRHGLAKADRDPMTARLGSAATVAGSGYYLDAGVSATVDKPGRATANFLDQQVDKKVIDGTVNGIGKLFIVAGNGLRHIQDGYIRRYALGITVGIASLLLFILAYAVR